MTKKKTHSCVLGVGMATLKDWGEEEYKNLARSSHTWLSESVFKGPFHLKELKLEVGNEAFSERGFWKKDN